MKKLLTSAACAIMAAPVAFACDGGTAGYDLPPPPEPTTVESLVASFASNPALYVGLAVGTVVGALVMRQRRSAARSKPATATLSHPAA